MAYIGNTKETKQPVATITKNTFCIEKPSSNSKTIEVSNMKNVFAISINSEFGFENIPMSIEEMKQFRTWLNNQKL